MGPCFLIFYFHPSIMLKKKKDGEDGEPSMKKVRWAFGPSGLDLSMEGASNKLVLEKTLSSQQNSGYLF